MLKKTQLIKRHLILNKPHLWPNYLVLVGLLFRLFSSYAPGVLAEDQEPLNYSLTAPEVTYGPSLISGQPLTEDSLILQEKVFVQSLCSICDSYIKLSKQTTIKKRVIVTAYSSTFNQTDNTPFITANGTHVYDGIVACNFLSLGTKIKFPEIYGDKIFTVEDRMAKQNNHKMDIWMFSRELALEFGVKKLTVEIVE